MIKHFIGDEVLISIYEQIQIMSECRQNVLTDPKNSKSQVNSKIPGV